MCQKIEKSFPKTPIVKSAEVIKAIDLSSIVKSSNIALKNVYADLEHNLEHNLEYNNFTNTSIESAIFEQFTIIGIEDRPFIVNTISEIIDVAVQMYPQLMKFDSTGLLTDAD